jgi:hypothetical protein
VGRRDCESQGISRSKASGLIFLLNFTPLYFSLLRPSCCPSHKVRPSRNPSRQRRLAAYLQCLCCYRRASEFAENCNWRECSRRGRPLSWRTLANSNGTRSAEHTPVKGIRQRDLTFAMLCIGPSRGGLTLRRRCRSWHEHSISQCHIYGSHKV